MTDAKTSPMNLMATTSLDALISTITPAERVAGRFLRAPDHGEGDGEDNGGDQDQGGNDKGVDGDKDAGEGDKDEGKDGADDGDDEADEKKGDDEKSLMGKAKDGEKDEAPAPPEKYELTAPEGFTIDEELLGKADPVFRDIGLTNEQAEKLMPLIPAFAEKLFAAQNDAHQAMAADWAKQAKADPYLGGRNWSDTENLVAKAFDTIAGKLPAIVTKDEDGKDLKLTGEQQVEAFVEMLDDTKIGNHPTMMRMFRWLGEQFGEGGDFVRPDSGAPVKEDRTAILYPDDVKKEGAN